MFSNEHCAKCVRSRSFFWSVFSRIRTEYGEILRISPYSVQSGKMWTKNFEYGLFPSSVVTLSLSLYIFSCDKKKNSLKKGKLENIDVNRAKVWNTFYAPLRRHIAVLHSSFDRKKSLNGEIIIEYVWHCSTYVLVLVAINWAQKEQKRYKKRTYFAFLWLPHPLICDKI